MTSPIPAANAAATSDQAAEMRHGDNSSQNRASNSALLDVAGTIGGADSISAAAAPISSEAVKVYLYSLVLQVGGISRSRVLFSCRRGASSIARGARKSCSLLWGSLLIRQLEL